MQASVASAKNEGKPAVNLDDVFAQELKKQVCNPDWKYSLPNSADVPDAQTSSLGQNMGQVHTPWRRPEQPAQCWSQNRCLGR